MTHAFEQLALMAAVTLGLVSVPHAMYYDNPRLVGGFWI
jgi:hypothetical protein